MESKELNANKGKTLNKKILFVASESQPFCATGGLADVIGALPKTIKKHNPECDVRVVLPLYMKMKLDRSKLKNEGNVYVDLSWRHEYCGIYSMELNDVKYYFLDNEKYFKRDGYYGYMDDGERFAFFSKAVLTILPKINFFPDIIHANDWQSALIPVYLKTQKWDKNYSKIKTVLTIHNIEYQGRYGKQVIGDVLGIAPEHTGLLEMSGDANLIKGGMICADRVVTVSKTYAKEIQTYEGGNGLDGIARDVAGKLHGITNGVDYSFYNPRIDNVIWANYDENSLEKKAINKEELQKKFGLEVKKDAPILAIVSRMVKHKGMDLIKATIENIITSTDAQFAAVGEGEREFEDFFKYLNAKYPNRVHVSLGFSVEIGKLIYAGADIYMMPSLSEPCGISQMIASVYGTVPVVREVGGLKDTILDFGNKNGTGYTFHDYNAHDFDYTLRRAINDYHSGEWDKKVKAAMKKDFSWKKSAEQYIDLYENM